MLPTVHGIVYSEFAIEFWAGIVGVIVMVLMFFLYLVMKKKHTIEAKLKRRAEWAKRFSRVEFNAVSGDSMIIDHDVEIQENYRGD